MSQRHWKTKTGSSKSSQAVDKPCVNPLFEQWLIEWKDDAVNKNSKMQYVFAKALSSLRKYPLKLTSGRECLLLEFFGSGLCKMIDTRLSKENIVLSSGQSSQNSEESQILSGIVEAASQEASIQTAKKRSKNKNDSEEIQSKKKKGAQNKGYIPGYRSGAYALLVTLLKKEETPNYRGYMLKTELQREAQPYCDASFTKSDNPGSNYTSWNTMSTLVNKELVIRQGNPVKFMLTMEGRELALSLLNADENEPKTSQRTNTSQESLDSNEEVPDGASDFHRVTFEPGQFEIVLCVDTAETTTKCKQEEVIAELRKNGVNLEVVRLSVGDFVWIIRHVVCQTGNSRRLTISKTHDLILPYIVERKRSDDLAGSIKDGRFHEQKQRLEKTGLNPIYLIEDYGRGDFGLAEGALAQALANTQITNGFLVQETANIKDTCGYLTHMTRLLSNIYKTKTISNCTKEEWPSLKNSTTSNYLMSFSDFNEFSIKLKNWTVTEMFARHLMCLRGLSVDRAYAITQRYPTLQSFLRAYRHCGTDKEKDSLVASIFYGTSGKTVGPSISKALSRLYNAQTL